MFSKYDYIFVIAIALAMIGFMGYILSNDTDSLYKKDIQRRYNLYKDCKVLEVAHYNGFLKGDTNKLDCKGTIYNVDTSDYNEAMTNH